MFERAHAKGRTTQIIKKSFYLFFIKDGKPSGYYEGHLESKERFAAPRYLLIIGKKQNTQVLSHTFTYFST